MKAASKIVAGAVVASMGAAVLVSTPAAAQPRTLSKLGYSVRVQTVDSTANAKQLEAQADQLNKLLQTFIADTGFGTAATNIPKAKLTTLLVDMITKQDPSIAPEVALKTAGALADLVTIAMSLSTSDIATVVKQSGPLSAAVGEIAAETAAGQGPSPDAMAKLIAAGAPTAKAVLSLLISGLTAYYAAKNLPQLNDILDVIDPLSTDGAKVFNALPAQARVPEVQAMLHIMADFGRTLASIDLIKVLKVAQYFTNLIPSTGSGS